MAGFTLSGGFHFDSTGEGVATAGITARGMGGMTFTPPPPPPPSFESYTYQAIERVNIIENKLMTLVILKLCLHCRKMMSCLYLYRAWLQATQNHPQDGRK